ncbi:MAG: creatininase family protein [Bacteroidales bacterium]
MAPVYWGIADIANCFPGTFTVQESTMKALLSDVFASLHRWGVKKIVVFNGHGEPKHVEVLHRSVVDAYRATGMDIYVPVDRTQLP